MNNRIEQEVNKTLEGLDDSFDIQISSVFIESLSGKISHLRMRRSIGYRSRAFYPVAILLLVVMNTAILAGSFGKQRSNSNQYDQTGIMAAEYGIGQNSYTAF